VFSAQTAASFGVKLTAPLKVGQMCAKGALLRNQVITDVG
jgi:hypothetical protein